MILKLIASFMLALAAVMILMPYYISYLKKLNYNQAVSEYSLKEYQEKAKTPVMGGVLFVGVPIIIALILGNDIMSDINVTVVMLAFIGYALIGFLDDYIIVIRKNNAGLRASHKAILQVALSIVFYLIYSNNVTTIIEIPLLGFGIELGFLYAFFVFFMFVAESNAVNITDGMDGLAGGCSFIALIPFLLFSIMQEQWNLAILISAVLGSLLGYLRFNVFPAKIFMGDTGSLALGGLLASIAMVLKQEVALIIIGGIFVYEASCVIIQLSSVKLRKKRVFKFTPIHYSFVLGGNSEKKVVYCFWLAAIALAVLGFGIGVL